MRKTLFALSIVAAAAAACSEPTHPPIPQKEPQHQDSLPPQTSGITPADAPSVRAVLAGLLDHA